MKQTSRFSGVQKVLSQIKGSQAGRLLLIIAASMLMALNIKSFVNAGGLFPGGFNGLTLLIQRSAAQFAGIDLPFSPINLLLNAIPAILSFRLIGKWFTTYSCLMIALTSVLTDLIPPLTLTNDVLLVCIFGGIIQGLAISLCLMGRATSGGTDFIAIYLSEKKGVDAWNMVLGLNVVILAAAGILFGWDKALYSIIFQFASTQVLHMTYKRYQQQTLFVVTNRPDMVAEVISHLSHHGATVIDAQGSYDHCDRKIVYSVVSTEESKAVLHAVKVADPAAFINVVKTQQISGRFYQKPNE